MTLVMLRDSLITQVKKALDLAPHLPVLRQIPPGLTHEPERRRVEHFALQGAKQRFSSRAIRAIDQGGFRPRILFYYLSLSLSKVM